MRFFPDLAVLDEQDICPTMKTFELGGGTDSSLDLPFLKAPENWRDDHPESQTDEQNADQMNDQSAPFGMDDDDAGMGGFDLAPEVAFGEGGEAWARDAALEPQMRVFDASAGADVGEDDGAGEVGVFDNAANAYGVTLQHRPDHDQENILNYFDNAMQKNWAGPEHWKIARIKEATKDKDKPKTTRKEKEPFEIDFSSPMTQDLANILYTSAINNSTISLPKKEWKSRTRNLLPDDKHFNSKDLLKLFLKPKAKLGARSRSSKQEAEVDEAYWAAQARAGADIKPGIHPMDDDAPLVQGDYDANFFQDDGLPMVGGAMDDDDDDFADAQENFLSPDGGVEGAEAPVGEGIDSIPMSSSADAFGANLVAQSRRMRPEYVQYARVAKKVDVRRLKEEMWRGIGYEAAAAPPETPNSNQRLQIPSLSEALGGEKAELMFTDIMNNLQHVYPRQQMRDISTSYGFICLLHLANEKGLVVENCEEMGWRDLRVRRDFEAVVGGGE
jgi:condensin complex subunit 2